MKNPKEIIFVTNNYYKFQIAKKALRGSPYKLVQKRLDTPEIQDESVEKVAGFSARWASDILKKPVIVSDGGCYIEALNGFPGPFIKYINKWISPKDLLSIMRDKKNRHLTWRVCLAYCEPKGKPVTFVSIFEGRIPRKIGKNNRANYGWIDSLFVPNGLTRPLSELPNDEYLSFWHDNIWENLIFYLEKRTHKK